MSLRKISILGYRGFASEQTLEFSIPDQKAGSGLTVLIGPNNGGKSTIIECLNFECQTKSISISQGKRNSLSDNSINIRLENKSGNISELKTVGVGGSETVWSDPKKRREFDNLIYVLPSRRYFNPFFGKGSTERNQYILSQMPPSTRAPVLNNFTGRLFKIQEKTESKNKYNEIFGKVIDPVPQWYIELSDSEQYFLNYKTGEHEHNSEGLGEGIISLMFIIDALYDSEPGNVIVIDEPELSLHPSLQKKLLSLFLEYSKTRQIIIATHSPHFIDFPSLINGGSIARVHKKNDTITINQLKKTIIQEELKGLLENLNNPHILGLNSKEVFFLDDRIILVEGQEDVVLYREKVLREIGIKLNGDFFGWGVGGASNMTKIAKVLSDLGFEKVVGILDKNVEDEKNRLETDFPHYKFFVIPADDVRTKTATDSKPETKGLLDKNYKIRDEYRAETEEIFSRIDTHLRN